MDRRDLDRRIAAVAALDQPLRRDLYRLLSAAGGWTTRDEAAAELDVARSVAAFHLDKLAEAGVVEVRYERLGGRQGPGAGRPSKLYRVAGGEVAASVPERRYDLAGSLLAAAVAESTRTGVPVVQCLRDAAHAAGERLATEAVSEVDGLEPDERQAAVLEVLSAQGYEPVVEGPEISLGNCPFHRLAEEHRDLVCGMNVDFLDGLLDGLGPGGGMTARLAPAPGSCCVRIAVA